MGVEKLRQPAKGRLIVSGILFWSPLAGVTYQFLHYLIGLRRLGYDPYYIEDSGRWVYDPRINDTSGDASGNVNTVAPILEAYGFADRWAFRGKYPGGQCYGMTEQQILQMYRAEVLAAVDTIESYLRRQLPGSSRHCDGVVRG
jgi:hypothetical protein